MAIFTNTAVVEQSKWDQLAEQYSYIDGTPESSENICYEFASDVHKIIGATYVADIMIENAMASGEDNVHVLIEEASEGTKKKFSERIKEFAKKLAVWFRKVMDRIKAYVSNGSKFVNKYREDLYSAFNALGKKYTYEVKGLQMNADPERVMTTIAKNAKVVHDNARSAIMKVDEEKDAEIIKNLIEDLEEYKFFADTNYMIAKKNSDKSYATGTITNIAPLISAVSGFKQSIDFVNRLYKTSKDQLKAADAEIKKENDISRMNKKMTSYTYLINTLQRVNSMATTMMIRANNECMYILKGILSEGNKAIKEKGKVKAATDSATEFSIFESALDLL